MAIEMDDVEVGDRAVSERLPLLVLKLVQVDPLCESVNAKHLFVKKVIS